MKRFLARSIALASAALIAFGIYTLTEENKNLDSEIKSLGEKLAKLDAKTDEVKTSYAQLEAKSPLEIYETYNCAVHIDTRVLENNALQPYSASGTLYRSESGELFIITNFHVFDRKAGQFLLSAYARFNTPGSYPEPIELFAWDPVFDLALVKFKHQPKYDGPVATFGKSASLSPGTPVIAVGSGGGFAFSCSAGVIRSINGMGAHNTHPALHIHTPNVILHTADFANGASGGPLITADGEVVGINYALMNLGPNGMYVNFYMAIPADDISRVIPRLLRGGEISHGWNYMIFFGDTCELPTLGLPGGARPPQEGVVVASIISDLFAEPRPKMGDIVCAINGIEVASRIEFYRELMHSEPGTTATLLLRRGEDYFQFSLPVVKYELPP